MYHHSLCLQWMYKGSSSIVTFLYSAKNFPENYKGCSDGWSYSTSKWLCFLPHHWEKEDSCNLELGTIRTGCESALCIVLVWNQFQLYLIPVHYYVTELLIPCIPHMRPVTYMTSLHELEFTTSLIFDIFCIYLIMYLLAVKTSMYPTCVLNT